MVQTGHTTKLLVIGMDGADPDLIDTFVRSGHMPTLAKLKKRGFFGPLQSTLPPTTLPAWTSFMTGVSPGTHGVPDFTIRRGYQIKFIGGNQRKLPTWFSHMESQGLTVGTAWFPATYPPCELQGYQISGWDSPVTSKGDRTFVHPPSLHRDLLSVFKDAHVTFDAIDEFSSDGDWHPKALQKLLDRVHMRGQMASWLLDNRPVDVAAFYFGETDTVAHHFWGFHDENSPRGSKGTNDLPKDSSQHGLKTAIRDVYSAVDTAIGTLYDKVGPEAHLVIVSDHGSGGSSDWGFYINRFLQDRGLLHFKKNRLPTIPMSALRGIGVERIPGPLRRYLFNLFDGLAPSAIESTIRFRGIDWRQTSAFSEEISYAPSIWLNQLGREPQGCVPYRQRTEMIKKISSSLSEVRFSDGTPVVKKAHPREDLYDGPSLHLIPDIILELHQVDGYTPVCLPSEGMAGPMVSKLSGAALQGRKGRSLPGCHKPYGILAVDGPLASHGSPANARIQDVPGLLCSLMGIPQGNWFDCQNIAPEFGYPTLPDDPTPKAMEFPLSNTEEREYTVDEERVVADRLKRLGYLEE